MSPLDLIPDVLPLIGYADDMAIIGLILASLGEELLRFEAYEHSLNADDNASSVPSTTPELPAPNAQS